MSKYDEKYYNSLNYVDYLSREGRYAQTAKELSSLLEQVGVISKDSTILDFGCAVGFLVSALTSLDYANVSGYDISEWATAQAVERGVTMLDSPAGQYDTVFCLDVFEHMTDLEVSEFFSQCKARAYVLRIPCSANGGESFALNVSNEDPTHINCKTKEQWLALFRSAFPSLVLLDLHTFTVYDSEGVMCCLLLPGGE